MFSACVQVLEANENDESFLVRWTQNSKTKWVSRVNIYFAPLETAEHATRRRQQALNHRMRTEAKLRFSRKMSAGPASAVTALSPAKFWRIVSRLGLPQKHEKHDRSRAVAGLAEEVVQHYAETMTLCKHRRIFPLEDPEVMCLALSCACIRAARLSVCATWVRLNNASNRFGGGRIVGKFSVPLHVNAYRFL